MNRALKRFNDDIVRAAEHSGLHVALKRLNLHAMNCDDILRFQIVHSVSALDKLIHDLIVAGMVDIFIGKRPPTPKYLNESMSMKTFQDISKQTFPPKEYLFKEFVAQKLKTMSYQHPNNIADGLSYIWCEPHKWKKIAFRVGKNEGEVRKSLILIMTRRNSIVHEGDINLSSGEKNSIDRLVCESATDLIKQCGTAIAEYVSEIVST